MRQRIPLIVTTRPEGYTKDQYPDSKFTRMLLAPLDRKQQEEIIDNRIGRPALQELRPNLDAMKDSDGNSICSNPLMLSMVISLFQSGGGSLPSSRFELYKKAVSMMLSRVDFKHLGEIRERTKSGRASFDLLAVERLMQKVALRRHHARDKDILAGDIEQAVQGDETLRVAWGHTEARVMAGRLPVLSCLEHNPLKLRYSHLSFQEFFVAQEWVECCNNSLLAESKDQAALPTLVHTLDPLTGGWWHNTMRMACQKSTAVIQAFARPYLPRRQNEEARPLSTGTFGDVHNPAISIIAMLLDNEAAIGDALGPPALIAVISSAEEDVKSKTMMATIAQRLLQQPFAWTEDVQAALLRNGFLHFLVTLESSSAIMASIVRQAPELMSEKDAQGWTAYDVATASVRKVCRGTARVAYWRDSTFILRRAVVAGI